MASTRYSESRTLVRRLRRPPGESREAFKANVLRLRRQFEQFNVDVSELCQWLMAFRPGAKNGDDVTMNFWEIILETEQFLDDRDKEQSDTYRRMIFDVAAGLEAESSIADVALSESVLEAVRAAGKMSSTPTARKLFARLSEFDVSHRQVLIKAAAEWIVARYLRGCQNWERQREEWEKEKARWEREHAELAEEIRQEFNGIFKNLHIKIRRPRVCTWERLKANKNDCEWAGQRICVAGSWKSHSSLCVKYKEFFDGYARQSASGKVFKRYFVENAKDWLKLRTASRGTEAIAIAAFLREHPSARWFPEAWKAYLKAIEINEQTLMAVGCELPHCVDFGVNKECQHNKHTNECQEYRRCLEKRPDLQPFEGVYRQWRRCYFSGPAKPCFQYPSQRKLPMPKIFGKDFFRVDFVNSLLELRLEGSNEGQFERFRFAPWPADYEPMARDAEITSVQIHFVGTRARAGFRFRVEHKKSRFAVGQDEIDDLRSRRYPRQAQDAQFLDEARERLLESFDGDAERELWILAVDLGTGGAGAVVFKGRCFKKAESLKVVKIDRLYDARPKQDKAGKEKPSAQERKKAKERGLGAPHVGRHLESWARGAQDIARKRGAGAEDPGTGEIADHDMRRLSLHVRWMIRDWVRLNASQVIESAERNKVDLIVFESMRGFRLPGYDRLDEDRKRRLAFFAHGRIRHKVREKAVERGMRVVTVPYLMSSQVCAECGKQQDAKNTLLTNKRKGIFRCDKCAHQSNSDENAARVLARVFWGELNLPNKLQEGT